MNNLFRIFNIRAGLVIKIIIAGYFLSTALFLSLNTISSGSQSDVIYLDSRYHIFASSNISGNSSSGPVISQAGIFNY